jgi:aminoglycoside phosphotransferase (APT) family kinase protein
MDFASLTPLEGGWSGETFLAEAGGERSVIRIFADQRHAPQAAETQAALLHLVRGLVPVPEVMEVRPARDGLPAMLVTAYVAGERGDLLLPRLDDAGLAAVGRALGRIAAVFAGMPQPVGGLFTGPDLAVEPREPDLVSRTERHDLPGIDADGLRAVAEEARGDLDRVSRVSLVHGDLDPGNILLDPRTLEVSAVVDLERAHAGHPFADLGSLLRLHRVPAYAGGVLTGWTELRGGDPAEALELGRAADLLALVDLAGRSGGTPATAAAHRLLAAIAAQRDRHAQPAESL